jgi:hypothetical protein
MVGLPPSEMDILRNSTYKRNKGCSHKPSYKENCRLEGFTDYFCETFMGRNNTNFYKKYFGN